MAKKLLDVEAFRKSKDLEGNDGLVKVTGVAIMQTKAADGTPLAGIPSVDLGERQVLFKISDATVDRYGDTIDPNGWIVDTFNKSGSVLWAHDACELPVAKAVSVFVQNGALWSVAEFPDAETYAFADTCYRLILAGALKGVSVGFRPLEWKYVDNDPSRGVGIDFTKQELLEYSLTPVPANPSAIVVAKQAGISLEPMRQWAANTPDAAERAVRMQVAKAWGLNVEPVKRKAASTSVEVQLGVAGADALEPIVVRLEKALEGFTKLAQPVSSASTLARSTAIADSIRDALGGVTKAGKVLSKANADRLEQARSLIADVLSSSQKSSEDELDPDEDTGEDGEPEDVPSEDEDKSATADVHEKSVDVVPAPSVHQKARLIVDIVKALRAETSNVA